ncbi:hypothetical protein OU997_05405 [Pseudomonas sp. SL4(2022)]|uniref:hypothetical protein n=1 Tax=Pseudomonas sp. SL4(2022) TaxID=2994661 RepID=UPI00226F50F0|nr:hypothetical protein [Pseudomonas sp. SL4(2022)]WAC45610.1 hypothetical protein OU997_05405 [Pseudomonas sp. SL4(2022)]
MRKKQTFWVRYRLALIIAGAVIAAIAFVVTPLVVPERIVNAYASLLAGLGTVGAIFTTIWLATNQNRIADKEAVVRNTTAKKAISIISREAFECFLKIDKELRGKIGMPKRNERLEQIAYSALIAMRGIDLMNLPDERLIKPIATLINCLERRLVYNPGEHGLTDEALLHVVATNAWECIDSCTKT